ncbi:unnamed protein product [Symbiodinium sp. CCMP2592]|nr:unnamed protein product [Symbiodinium sp. CCMP2592]
MGSEAEQQADADGYEKKLLVRYILSGSYFDASKRLLPTEMFQEMHKEEYSGISADDEASGAKKEAEHNDVIASGAKADEAMCMCLAFVQDSGSAEQDEHPLGGEGAEEDEYSNERSSHRSMAEYHNDVMGSEAQADEERGKAEAAENEKKLLVRHILRGSYCDASKRLLRTEMLQEMHKDGRRKLGYRIMIEKVVLVRAT